MHPFVREHVDTHASRWKHDDLRPEFADTMPPLNWQPPKAAQPRRAPPAPRRDGLNTMSPAVQRRGDQLRNRMKELRAARPERQNHDRI